MRLKAWHGGLGALALGAVLGFSRLTQLPVDQEAQAPAAVRPLALPVAPPAALASAVPVPLVPQAAVAVVGPSELDRLVAAARRGDARAGYAAYQALSACSGEKAGTCGKLPYSLLQERLRFLTDAANAGVAAAQIDFYMEGPGAQQAMDGDALLAWRQQALSWLKSAATQCEPFAMGLLATLYDAGELTPRDAAQAIAYAVAEGQLRRRPPSDDGLRDRLAEPIEAAALDAARRQGLSLAAACR